MPTARPPARPRRTLLVTGFGAFPGAPCNPTEGVVAELRRERGRFARLGVDLRCAVLPVRFGELQARLEALAAAHRPDAILLLGVAGRRRLVSVETRAVNYADPIKPDADGCCPASVVMPDGAPSLEATYPGERIAAALHAAGIGVELSRCAGDYVCNAALYRALATALAPEVGFIHVPKPRPRPSPPTAARFGRATRADLNRAARLALLVLARVPPETAVRLSRPFLPRSGA